MMTYICPYCKEELKVEEGINNTKCTKCGAKLMLCPQKDCQYAWTPRKKNPVECPRCKRYLPKNVK